MSNETKNEVQEYDGWNSDVVRWHDPTESHIATVRIFGRHKIEAHRAITSVGFQMPAYDVVSALMDDKTAKSDADTDNKMLSAMTGLAHEALGGFAWGDRVNLQAVMGAILNAEVPTFPKAANGSALA